MYYDSITTKKRGTLRKKLWDLEPHTRNQSYLQTTQVQLQLPLLTGSPAG